MIKHIILFLSFLFVPMSVFADLDRCVENGKYAKEYTIDKRCYVTDTLRKEKPKPYNAVVALVDTDGDIYCTGTVVEYNGKLYIYTAKHCVINDLNVSQDVLIVQPQEGDVYYVSKNNIGDMYQKTVILDEGKTETTIKNDSGDWAIYNIPGKLGAGMSSVKISTKTDFGVGPATADYAARVVGYGALKIMSDKEIKDFKQKYIDFLKWAGVDTTKGTEAIYGFNENGGIIANVESNEIWKYFKNYLKKTGNSKYWNSLFFDKKLKVSYCKYSSNGKMTSCQRWGGNSGGGIFDIDGNLMAIVTRSNYTIGGTAHAGALNVMFDLGTDNIILLRSPIRQLLGSDAIKPKE